MFGNLIHCVPSEWACVKLELRSHDMDLSLLLLMAAMIEVKITD